jgi:hypothetical protein
MKKLGNKQFLKRMSLNPKLKLTLQVALVTVERVERDIELIINHFHLALGIRVLQ